MMLSNYAFERLLYRIGCSRHKNKFILKGAMLFRIWSDEPHRATRDLDLLTFGNPETAKINQLFQEICNTPVENDGVIYNTDSIRFEEIVRDRNTRDYGPISLHL